MTDPRRTVERLLENQGVPRANFLTRHFLYQDDEAPTGSPSPVLV